MFIATSYTFEYKLLLWLTFSIKKRTPHSIRLQHNAVTLNKYCQAILLKKFQDLNSSLFSKGTVGGVI